MSIKHVCFEDEGGGDVDVLDLSSQPQKRNKCFPASGRAHKKDKTAAAAGGSETI